MKNPNQFENEVCYNKNMKNPNQFENEKSASDNKLEQLSEMADKFDPKQAEINRKKALEKNENPEKEQTKQEILSVDEVVNNAEGYIVKNGEVFNRETKQRIEDNEDILKIKASVLIYDNARHSFDELRQLNHANPTKEGSIETALKRFGVTDENSGFAQANTIRDILNGDGKYTKGFGGDAIGESDKYGFLCGAKKDYGMALLNLMAHQKGKEINDLQVTSYGHRDFEKNGGVTVEIRYDIKDYQNQQKHPEKPQKLSKITETETGGKRLESPYLGIDIPIDKENGELFDDVRFDLAFADTDNKNGFGNRMLVEAQKLNELAESGDKEARENVKKLLIGIRDIDSEAGNDFLTLYKVMDLISDNKPIPKEDLDTAVNFTKKYPKVEERKSEKNNQNNNPISNKQDVIENINFANQKFNDVMSGKLKDSDDIESLLHEYGGLIKDANASGASKETLRKLQERENFLNRMLDMMNSFN